MNGLVSWEAAENHGKIPGSNWVCPAEGYERITALRQAGQDITDQVALEAGGRWQHLALLSYPEGYEAAQIIDSETGAPAVGQMKDSGLEGNSSPRTTVPLQDGREISSVLDFGGNTESIIKPAVRPLDSPLDREAGISPDSRQLYVKTKTPLDTIPGVFAEVTIAEVNGESSGKVSLARQEGTEQVNLTLDNDGQAKALQVYGSGLLLTAMGVRFDSNLPQDAPKDVWTGEWEVADDKLRHRIFEAAAEALCGDKANGLDLYLTAAGLYAALGKQEQDFNLSSTLVFRDRRKARKIFAIPNFPSIRTTLSRQKT